jgi:hypothetical protein
MLAEKNNLLNFETLYQDGFFIKANASHRRNHTRKSLKTREERMQAALREIIKRLKNSDEDEDSIKKKRKLEEKIAEIHNLREELNEKIQQRLDGKRPDKVDAEKISINPTDGDSSIMKMKDKSYANAYMKITAVDAKADIIVGSVVEGYYDESHRAVQLFRLSNKNCGGLGRYTSVCFDSAFNTLGTCAWFDTLGVEVIAPTKQHEHAERNPGENRITFDYDEKTHTVLCSEGFILTEKERYVDSQKGSLQFVFCNEQACKSCSRLGDCTSSKNNYRLLRLDSRNPLQKKVLERYKSKEGQKIYKKRSHVAETFQGDLKNNGKFDRFHRRGQQKVRIESILHDIVWNLRRIFNSKSTEIIWT